MVLPQSNFFTDTTAIHERFLSVSGECSTPESFEDIYFHNVPIFLIFTFSVKVLNANTLRCSCCKMHMQTDKRTISKVSGQIDVISKALV